MNVTSRIKLTASGDRESAYKDQPVTIGIPLKEGSLKYEDLDEVTLTDEDGRPYRLQTQCTATWKNDLKDVKWLLADTIVSLKKGEEKGLYLNLNGDGEAAPSGQSISVTEEDDSYIINTGVMRVRLRKDFPIYSQPYAPDFFRSLQLRTSDGWREMLNGDHGVHLYMKDTNGTVYDGCTKGFHPRLAIEEAGPLRCCVKVDGLHHSLDGRTFCPYVLRLHFYAGKADVKIFHTFVFDQNPEFIALSAVGIRVPVDLGNQIRAEFAGSEKPHIADDWREFSFTQTNHNSYTVERNGKDFAKGTRSFCRASMLGSRGSLSAVFRDGWQEYPFGFNLKPGVMEIEVWPEKADTPLEFTTPFHEPPIAEFNFDPYKVIPGEEDEFVRIINERPTAPISVKHVNPRSHEKIAWVEEMLEKHAKGRVIGYNDMHTNNGIGAAKTSEVHLRFSAETPSVRELDELAASVQAPLAALPEASHVCASEAFGSFYHSGDPQFRQVDEKLDRVFYEVSFEPDELCEHYGKMRYGNLPGTHSAPSHWVYCHYKKKDPLKAARYMGPHNNEANDEIFAFWGGFIRTGRRDYFLRAQKFSRCVADVSTIHFHPERPENVGGMHGHSCHCWTGNPSKSHSMIAGYLTDYYFTGNRRLLDVAEETASRIFDHYQERIGIVANRGNDSYGIGFVREYTGAISVLMDIYQATWKEKYFWLAERSFNILLKSLGDTKYIPHKIMTSGYMGNEIHVAPNIGGPGPYWGNLYWLLESALRLTEKNPVLEKLIIDFADYFAWESPFDIAYYDTSVICSAYRLTGNLQYAAFAQWIIEDLFDSFMKQKDQEGAIAPGDDRVNGYIPKLMWLVKDASTRYPKAFEEACREWREKLDAAPERPMPKRPDPDPFISLGQLSPDANS